MRVYVFFVVQLKVHRISEEKIVGMAQAEYLEEIIKKTPFVLNRYVGKQHIYTLMRASHLTSKKISLDERFILIP